MAINLNALKTEINTDPLALGYAGKTDAEVVNIINTVPGTPSAGRLKVRTSVPIDEVFKAIDDAAWPATAILQNKLQGILIQSTIDASNANTRGIIGTIFPNSGVTVNTRNRLLALQDRPASRAEFLFDERVETWDVARARVV